MFWRHDDTYTHSGHNPARPFPGFSPAMALTLYSVTLVTNHTCAYLHSIRILTALKGFGVFRSENEISLHNTACNWVQLVLIVRIGCFLYDVHTHTHRKYYAKLS